MELGNNLGALGLSIGINGRTLALIGVFIGPDIRSR